MMQTLFEWYEISRQDVDVRTYVMPVPGGAIIRHSGLPTAENDSGTETMVFVPDVDVRMDAANKVFLTGRKSHDLDLVTAPDA